MSGTANTFDDKHEPECNDLDSIWDMFKCFTGKLYTAIKEIVFDH